MLTRSGASRADFKQGFMMNIMYGLLRIRNVVGTRFIQGSEMKEQQKYASMKLKFDKSIV